MGPWDTCDLSHGTYFAPDCNRSVKDAMHAQDSWLRRVDDGRPKKGSKYATITDGECATIHILNGKLIFASLKWEKNPHICWNTWKYVQGEREQKTGCWFPAANMPSKLIPWTALTTTAEAKARSHLTVLCNSCCDFGSKKTGGGE